MIYFQQEDQIFPLFFGLSYSCSSEYPQSTFSVHSKCSYFSIPCPCAIISLYVFIFLICSHRRHKHYIIKNIQKRFSNLEKATLSILHQNDCIQWLTLKGQYFISITISQQYCQPQVNIIVI